MPDWISYFAMQTCRSLKWSTFIFVLFVVACSRVHLIPEGGVDMLEVYQQTDATQSTPAGIDITAYRMMRDDRSRLEDYTRTKDNELDQLFPMIPNPKFEMYVRPHITDSNATVPGYTTGYTLYTRDYYALPGEVVQQ